MAGPGHGHGPRGPRHGMPVPKIENPGKIFSRLMGYVWKKYGLHYVIVLICIALGVFASVQGTLFLQTLIDDYIAPLIGQANPDFTNLLGAIIRVSGFYLLGVVSAFVQARIMVYVTQGTLKNLRDDYVYWLDIVRQNLLCRGYEDILVDYRMRDDSLTASKKNMIQPQWNVYRNILKLNIFTSFFYLCTWAFNGVKKYKKI